MSRYLSVPNWVNRLSRVSSQAEITEDEDDDNPANYPRAPSPRSQRLIDQFRGGFRGIPASIASPSPPPEPPLQPFGLTSPHITSDNGTLPISPGGAPYLSPERPPPILHGRVHDIDIRVHPPVSPMPMPSLAPAPIPTHAPKVTDEPAQQPRVSAYAHILHTLREMPWLSPDRITVDWIARPSRPRGPPQSWYTGQPAREEEDLEAGLGLGLEKGGYDTGKSSFSVRSGYPFPRKRATEDEEPIPPPPELYIQRSSNEPPQQLLFDPVHSPLVTRSHNSWLGQPFIAEPTAL